jgi:Holliday junction resolvase
VSNVSRGHGRERDLVKLLKERGRWAMRAPASLGTVDVVASPPLTFYEVKTSAAGPYAHFGPADREELLRDARRACAAAVLCWWPPDRKGARFIHSEDWP